MAANQKELARLAGVSQVTVSRVLRGTPGVSPKLRQRVLQTTRLYKYYPRSDARAMRRGKFQRIACAVTQYGPKGSTHCIYNGYLDPATDTFAEHGYSTIFEIFYMNVRTHSFIEAPRLFSELSVDGVLGIHAAGPVASYVDDRLAELDAPVIWVNRNSSPGVVSVTCDEYGGARALTRHLIDLGHREIGYFGADSSHHSYPDRSRGVRDELVAAGLDTSATAPMRSNEEVLYVEMLLDRRPRITGLVCHNLQFYLMAASAAGIRGLKIPQDLSIAYFANMWELFSLSNYPVTVMTVPDVLMSRAAANILMDALKYNRTPANIPPIRGQLIPGYSTTPPGREPDRNQLTLLKEQRRGVAHEIVYSPS